MVKEWGGTILGEDELMFSLDLKKMFTNIIRQAVVKEIERLIEKDEIIRGWKKEEILKNLKYIWDNTYCIIEEIVVKVENELWKGSKMNPVLAEIIMKGWEEENIDKERKILKFGRYVDDSRDKWKGKKTELEEKVKEMQDK